MPETKLQRSIRQFRLDMKNVYNLTPDRWGHYKVINKQRVGAIYRIKMQKTTYRIETQIGGNRWIRTWSGHYTKYRCHPDTVIHKMLLGCTSL